VNTNLISKNVQDFIEHNLNTDINKLILKGSPFKNCNIQEIAQQIEGKQKCSKKLPLWHLTKNILFPKKINIEQTSSEITAAYKADLVDGNSLIDLTGGFGVDCLYFSKKIKKVIHCELNSELLQLVTHNYNQFNIENIETVLGDSLLTLKNSKQKFDWIYIDPSRRNDAKGKVFLLKDCLPNVPENLEFLFENSQKILIKNSPILDITNTIRELKFVKEIHIIAIHNEVKELLFVLEKNYSGIIAIKTRNILKETTQSFDFVFDTPVLANYTLPKKYIYEPNAAILKSGAFNQIATHLHIDKLHQHSHLYTSDLLLDNFPGRKFKIEQQLSYDKKKLLKLLPDKKANITIRNFPETVAQIRKKTKIKDGGNIYLFFTMNCNNKKVILLCSKI